MAVKDKDQFMLDAYTGRGGFETGEYLITHPRETEAKLERRKELAVYPNYVKKVVESYLSHIFHREPNRSFKNKTYKAFSENADHLGHDVGAVIRKNFKLAMLQGVVFLIIDRPAGKAKTAQDERRLIPYIAPRLKTQLAGVEFDDFGAFSRIVFTEKRGDETVYRILDTERWIISRDRDGGGIISQGEHRLGIVPVVPLYSQDPLLPSSVSATAWAWDIAWLNFDLYNAVSELRELLRSQTFSILALPFRNKDEAERLKDLTISTENALPYNPEGGGKPDFIAPPDGPVSLYMEFIEKTIQRIYEVANLEFTGGVQASGVALAFKFQEANRTLATMAQLIEEAENRIAEIVCKWHGEEFNGFISYPRDFAVTDLLQELKMAMDALTLEISETFDKEVKKKVARSVLGNTVPDETLTKIDTEIDQGPDPYADRNE